MSWASSLTLIVTCSWTPNLNTPLDLAQNFNEYDPGRNDREHPDKHSVGLKSGAGLADHHSDSARGSVNLADHNSDHAAPDRQPQASEQEWNRAGQDD